MKRSIKVLFLLVSLALVTRPVLAQTVPPELVIYPDTILHNGKIATMDDKTSSSNPGTMAQALAIRDGKIIAAGSNQQILGLKGPQTKIVDLKGRTVVPGIIDTHSHLFDYALDAAGAKFGANTHPGSVGRDLGEHQEKGSRHSQSRGGQEKTRRLDRFGLAARGHRTGR